MEGPEHGMRCGVGWVGGLGSQVLKYDLWTGWEQLPKGPGQAAHAASENRPACISVLISQTPKAFFCFVLESESPARSN